MVREFFDVFLEDLSGLLLECEIEFPINVQPGTDSIPLPPYQMAPAELK